ETEPIRDAVALAQPERPALANHTGEDGAVDRSRPHRRPGRGRDTDGAERADVRTVAGEQARGGMLREGDPSRFGRERRDKRRSIALGDEAERRFQRLHDGQRNQAKVVMTGDDEVRRIHARSPAAAQTASIARASCGVVNGLDRSGAPVSRMRCCASGTAVYPDMKTTGRPGRAWRAALASSIPFIPLASTTSVRSTSGAPP